MQISEKFNFIEYASWAIQENKDSMQAKENDEKQDLLLTGFSQLDGDDMGKINWLFRQCQTLEKLNYQNSYYIENFFAIRHIFLFLLTIIHYSQATIQQISRLMKSIGLYFDEGELQLVHMENDDLLQLKFEKDTVQNIDVTHQDIRKLFQCILVSKQITEEELSKDINEAFNKEENFQINDIMLKFPIYLSQINSIHGNKLKEKDQLNKSIKLEKQKKCTTKDKDQQQSIQYKIKFSKVIHKFKNKSYQNKLLLIDGAIVTGITWFPNQSQYIAPLTLDVEAQVNYFDFCIPYLNHGIYMKDNSFLIYKGPINENFLPNVIKAQYDQNIDGILTYQNQYDFLQYKGCFQNGLFDGIGRMYFRDGLHYIGEFKVGFKYGEGRERYTKDLIYLFGKFENNKKYGQFTFQQLTDYSSRNKIWQQLNTEPKYYEDNIEVKILRDKYKPIKRSQIKAIRSLLNYQDYGINNFQLLTLEPGRWINSSIIDITINSILTQRLLINPKLKKNNTIFINCSTFQDIFGSLITKDEPLNFELFSQVITQYPKQNPIRFVFYFNLDRCHFLTVVYENNTLYFVDSLKSQNVDLLHQIQKLLKHFDYDVIRVFKDLHVSQQSNSYDCGIYTIYYVSQIIKNMDLSILDMIQHNYFQVDQQKINYTRYLIRRYLLQQGVELLQI